MTFGYSRDDIGKFLPTYLEKGILPYDPFQVGRLDVRAVRTLPSCIAMPAVAKPLHLTPPQSLPQSCQTLVRSK